MLSFFSVASFLIALAASLISLALSAPAFASASIASEASLTSRTLSFSSDVVADTFCIDAASSSIAADVFVTLSEALWILTTMLSADELSTVAPSLTSLITPCNVPKN